MKQATLKIKSYANNVSIIDNNNIKRRSLHFMLVSLGALSFLYVLFLGNMVWNITERKQLVSQEHTLVSEIGDLELSYLTASKNVDISLSESMGFVSVKPTFAVRKTLGSIKIAKGNEI